MTADVESAGIFSIAIQDAKTLLLVGGNYLKPDESGSAAALTTDGGKTWTAINNLPFQSGAAWAKDHWVTVGTAGSFSSADGKNWTRLDRLNYNAVQVTKTGEGWAVGPKGFVAKYTK